MKDSAIFVVMTQSVILEKTILVIEKLNQSQATEEVCLEPSSSDGNRVSSSQSACPSSPNPNISSRGQRTEL